MNAEIDVRPVLPTIRIPTLVIHRSDDRCLKVEEGRYVASCIPGAKYVELPGADHLPFVGDQEAILGEIEEFLTGVRHESQTTDSVLATVLVLEMPQGADDDVDDGVDDTVRRLPAHAAREIERFRGREMHTAGNRTIVIFDGPARAIRCAATLSEYARRLGLALRAGLHTGVVEIRPDTRVAGAAVDICLALAASAAPEEVLVSSTVKDLVAGSGIRFEERPSRAFPGLGEWRRYAVAAEWPHRGA